MRLPTSCPRPVRLSPANLLLPDLFPPTRFICIPLSTPTYPHDCRLSWTTCKDRPRSCSAYRRIFRQESQRFGTRWLDWKPSERYALGWRTSSDPSSTQGKNGSGISKGEERSPWTRSSAASVSYITSELTIVTIVLGQMRLMRRGQIDRSCG